MLVPLRLLLLCLLASFLLGFAQQSKSPTPSAGAPYLLDVCAISGRELPENGGVVVVVSGTNDPAQDGRQLRFCCNGCSGKFSKDPTMYIPKIDELMIKDQASRYPINTCLVRSSKELPDARGPEAANCTQVIYQNRLVRLCCGGCQKKFEADPSKYLLSLDAATIAQQNKDYPLQVCVLSGQPLGDNPNSFLVGDRLMKTCCGGCKKKVLADPRPYVKKLNAAEKTSGSNTVAAPKKFDLTGKLKGIPNPVQAEIAKKYPKARIVKSELDDNIWEVDIVTTQGAKRELKVSPDGWILDDELDD